MALAATMAIDTLGHQVQYPNKILTQSAAQPMAELQMAQLQDMLCVIVHGDNP